MKGLPIEGTYISHLPVRSRLVANLCAGNRRGYFTNNFIGDGGGAFYENIEQRVCIYIFEIYIYISSNETPRSDCQASLEDLLGPISL